MEQPSDRSLIASIAANRRWASAGTEQRLEQTEAARRAAAQKLIEKFEDEVDPDRLLDPADRAKRVANLVSAYRAELGRRGARVRKSKADARRQAALEDELARLGQPDDLDVA